MTIRLRDLRNDTRNRTGKIIYVPTPNRVSRLLYEVEQERNGKHLINAMFDYHIEKIRKEY